MAVARVNGGAELGTDGVDGSEARGRGRGGNAAGVARTLAAAISPVLEQLERRQMLSAGSLDATFAAPAGLVRTDFGGSSNDHAFAMGAQSTGKWVVVGQTGSQLGIIRYAADGQADGSFGVGGKVMTSVPGYNNPRALAVVIQADDKIVVAGTATEAARGDEDAIVIRYNADGSLDTGFGNNGVQTINFASTSDPAPNDRAMAVSVV